MKFEWVGAGTTVAGGGSSVGSRPGGGSSSSDISSEANSKPNGTSSDSGASSTTGGASGKPSGTTTGSEVSGASGKPSDARSDSGVSGKPTDTSSGSGASSTTGGASGKPSGTTTGSEVSGASGKPSDANNDSGTSGKPSGASGGSRMMSSMPTVASDRPSRSSPTRDITSSHTSSENPLADGRPKKPVDAAFSDSHSAEPVSPLLMSEPSSQAKEEAITEVKTLASEATELSKKSEQQVSSIVKEDELVLSEMITCLATATTINNKIQAAMNTLQQMAANNMKKEIDSLAQTTLSQVIETSLQLYQSLEVIDKCSGDVNGHIKRKCQEIQKDLIQVLDKLSGSDALRKMCKLSKKNDLVDDYNIPEDGNISDLPDQVQGQQQRTNLDNIKQLLQGFEDSKFEQGQIIGNPVLHKLGIQLNSLLSNHENELNSVFDDGNGDIEKSDDDQQTSATEGSTTANRDVTLVIDDEGRVENSEPEKTLPKAEIKPGGTVRVQVGNEVGPNPAATDTKTKDENKTVKISKKDLDKLKERSDNMYASLLQSVNKYDIGKISENCDPEHIPDTKLDKPRYALLARLTRNIQGMLLTRLRSALTKQYSKQQTEQDDLQFEFVFCVDNSGSMSGKKIREALTTLVILMETFHRLEWKFAVLRFGAEQKILKSLGHESMYDTVESGTSGTTTTETLSLQEKQLARGQYILESFTTDEKTLPATALKQIAENKELFGSRVKPYVKRFIIMITDGISAQTDTDLFTTQLQNAHADLYMVCIIPELPKSDDSKYSDDYKKFALEHEKKAKEFIQRVAPERNQLIEIGQLDTLTKTVVADLIGIIEQSILDYTNLSIARQTTTSTNNAIKFQPLHAFTVSDVRNVDLWRHPEIAYAGQFYVNDSRQKLEQQALQQQMDIDFSIASNEFIENVDKTMEGLEKSYSNLELHDNILVDTDKVLQQIEQQLETYIGEMVRTMEDNVLPAYKPTQSLPDTRGNRLFIPGIVKFICTQGQYNRIYLNQIGSQKPEYRIAILLDQSVSMTGPTYFSSVDMLLSICAALNKIGIEDFNVLTFGKRIELIKSYKQNYDRLFVHHLLKALKIDGETTLLSDAIFAASELLQQQSTYNNNHGPMFIFVLTDGYDKRGSFIHRIIAHAEKLSITVIGIGLGLESNGVCLSFNDWIIAQNPRLICDALINWSNEQSDGRTPNDPLYHLDKTSTFIGDDSKVYSSPAQVWNEEMKTHFDAITQNTKRTIDLTFSTNVHNTPLTVEICFVMDCTGSMGNWIEACKKYIKAIGDGIQKDMKEKFDKNSVLRMAFVAYRDFNGSNRFDTIDFHQAPNIYPVETKIASQQATGGADLCEDVQGGLDKALKLSWTKDGSSRAAQILVWVGDCPGHTSFCHNGGSGWDSYLGGLPDVPLMLTGILIIAFFLGLFLTVVLSDMENNDLDFIDDNHLISKRDIFHRGHRDDPAQSPGQCVPCKFGIGRCCHPNICVKKHLRPDKCLRIKRG
ncbi:unnamed protein product [Rotaria sp. Silwood1]|nr:unnamed protein product [Rotaria sp. Silwood1]